MIRAVAHCPDARPYVFPRCSLLRRRVALLGRAALQDDSASISAESEDRSWDRSWDRSKIEDATVAMPQDVVSCYNGGAAVMMADGTTKCADQIVIGDRLLVGSKWSTPASLARSVADGSLELATTVVLARTVQPANGRQKLVKLPESGMLISAMHRIMSPEGLWIEPAFYQGARHVCQETALYNFVVDGQLPIVVDGIVVSTLGTYCHGSHDSQWPTHELWGSPKIGELLREHPHWPNIRFEQGDNTLAVLKDEAFARKYVADGTPSNARQLLLSHHWQVSS
eukprot:SAG11_NODE_1677_length_4475_cov_3.568327_2_plen_283_part_00